MTTDILAHMTPTTLVQMHADALDAENPELAGSIRDQLVALVGDEADAMLGLTPQREPNQAAIDAFLRHITNSRGYVDTITQALDDHYDTLPEDVHWGHVGDAGHVADLLRQAAEFITGDEEDGELDEDDGPLPAAPKLEDIDA